MHPLLAQVSIDKAADPSQWTGLANSLGPERFLVVGLMVGGFVLVVLAMYGVYRLGVAVLGTDGWLKPIVLDVAAAIKDTFANLNETLAKIEAAVTAGRSDDQACAETHKTFRRAAVHYLVGAKLEAVKPEAADHYERALGELS